MEQSRYYSKVRYKPYIDATQSEERSKFRHGGRNFELSDCIRRVLRSFETRLANDFTQVLDGVRE